MLSTQEVVCYPEEVFPSGGYVCFLEDVLPSGCWACWSEDAFPSACWACFPVDAFPSGGWLVQPHAPKSATKLIPNGPQIAQKSPPGSTNAAEKVALASATFLPPRPRYGPAWALEPQRRPLGAVTPVTGPLGFQMAPQRGPKRPQRGPRTLQK